MSDRDAIPYVDVAGEGVTFRLWLGCKAVRRADGDYQILAPFYSEMSAAEFERRYSRKTECR
jgi:hypothetical protein